MFDQFTVLQAKVAFSMKLDGSKGRAMAVKPGDLFAVTNPRHMQGDGVKIDRKVKAKLNQGYMLTIEDINKLFHVKQSIR